MEKCHLFNQNLVTIERCLSISSQCLNMHYQFFIRSQWGSTLDTRGISSETGKTVVKNGDIFLGC